MSLILCMPQCAVQLSALRPCAVHESDTVFTTICSLSSTQLFGEYCIGQISDIRAQTHLKNWWRRSGTFSCSCHAVQESRMKAGSCRSRVYPDLSYLQVLSRLRMGHSGQLRLFSHTTGILNTHKPLWGTGGWVGKGNLPGSETATSWPIWASQGVAAGLRDRTTLWVGFLFTQISCCCPQHLPPPASMAPRHRIWQSFAGLQHLSCLLEPGTRLLSLGKQQAPHFGLPSLA